MVADTLMGARAAITGYRRGSSAAVPVISRHLPEVEEPEMDVVTQALHVASRVGEPTGIVSLTLDLENPAHRAAYSSALAVLSALGHDPSELCGETVEQHRVSAAVSVAETFVAEFDRHPMDAALRRSYTVAVEEIAGEPIRAARIVEDTFPIVRELLRDGVNVENLAQVQYHRWVDAQGDLRSHG